MSAAVSLASFEGLGWAFRLSDGKVKATPPPGAGDADISAMRAHREVIRLELVSRQTVTPCPADLMHDAAMIAQDDACPWPSALDGAAIGAGFASHDDAAATILDKWRCSIRSAQPATDAGRDALRDALRMLQDAGGDLIRAGWGASDLFGLHRGGDRHGLALRLRGGAVQLIGNDEITYRAGAVGRVTTFDRTTTASGAMPFWEIAQ